MQTCNTLCLNNLTSAKLVYYGKYAVALMLIGSVFASNRKTSLGEWPSRALSAAHVVERRYEGCPPGSS